MVVHTADLARQLLQTALALPGLTSGDEVDRATARMLSDMVACDEVVRTQLDLAAPAATARRGPTLAVDPLMSAGLARSAGEHPAVRSYLEPGDDRRPRRVSDVVSWRDWLGGPVYNEVFRDIGGRFQLSLVARLSASQGTGWVLTRSLGDFSDDDVDVATWLLPQVVTLHALADVRRGRPATGDDARDDAPPLAVPPLALTPREWEILRAIGTGASAHQAARALGISERTVAKHLEHAYAKLGVHDRISALNAARLLP